MTVREMQEEIASLKNKVRHEGQNASDTEYRNLLLSSAKVLERIEKECFFYYKKVDKWNGSWLD